MWSLSTDLAHCEAPYSSSHAAGALLRGIDEQAAPSAFCTQRVPNTGVTVSDSPHFGCRVIRHTCSSFKYCFLVKPSGGSNWKFASRTASAVRTSAMPRAWPMQLWGPQLKAFQEVDRLRRLPEGVASGCSAWPTYWQLICCSTSARISLTVLKPWCAQVSGFDCNASRTDPSRCSSFKKRNHKQSLCDMHGHVTCKVIGHMLV